jgi:aminoglycoside 2''-phosphotransferase
VTALNPNRFETKLEGIKRRHPDIAFRTVSWRMDGWANAVAVVDEAFVFRIPRDEAATRCLNAEAAILALLDGGVEGVACPKYRDVVVEENLAYVWYEIIQGTPWTEERRRSSSPSFVQMAAYRLGRFLQTLHSLQIIEPTPWIRWDSSLNHLLLEDLIRAGLPSRDPRAYSNLVRLLAAIASMQTEAMPYYAPIHGDLTSDHVLVEADRLGVIDFGDVAIGDPAYDFAGLVLSYGWDFMRMVKSHYERPLGERFEDRVRAYVAKASIHEWLYAVQQEGDDTPIPDTWGRLGS